MGSKGAKQMNCKIKEIFDRLTRLDKVEILKLNKTYKENVRLYGEDDNDTISDLESIIRPKALAYAREVIKKDGIPKDGEGWAFRPSILIDADEDIEVMIWRTEDGRFKPSTCSPAWEAKGHSVGDSLAVKDPAEALAWGLTEAFAYYLAGDIAHLRNGKHFPQNEIHEPTRRKAK
jgi:hypothetical protein